MPFHDDLSFDFFGGDEGGSTFDFGLSNLFDFGDSGGFDPSVFDPGAFLGGDVPPLPSLATPTFGEGFDGGGSPSFFSLLGSPTINPPLSLPGPSGGPSGTQGSFFPEGEGFPGLLNLVPPPAVGSEAFVPFQEPGGEGLLQPLLGQDVTAQLGPPGQELAGPMATALGNPAFAGPPVGTQLAPGLNFILGMDPRKIALGLGLGVTGVALVGLIQKMLQGDAAARTIITRKFQEGTPEERAAITAVLQGMQQMAQSPTGGIAPLDPNIAALVEQAFQPAMQNIGTQAIEAARRAGFHDNPLTSPGGAALAGPALAQLQGQMAAAKLALAQAIAQQRLAGFQNLGGILGNLQQARGFTQTQQGPRPTLFDLLGPLAQLMQGAGLGLSAFQQATKR